MRTRDRQRLSEPLREGGDGERETTTGRLREGARSYAKDSDGNYLATCQAPETGRKRAAPGQLATLYPSLS